MLFKDLALLLLFSVSPWDIQFPDLPSLYYSSRKPARQAENLRNWRGAETLEITAKGKREHFYLLWKSIVLQGIRYIALTLLTNIFHSRHQLLFKELALFRDFVSFVQEILCCLFNWSSQNVGLLRTPSLFIRGALVASVNQCCYLKV